MNKLQQIKTVLEGTEKIPINQLIGKRVVLYEDGYENDVRPFLYGHEFIIKSIVDRIYYLIDDNGNELSVLDKHIELI